ncbi:MAG: HlyD family secretion protein [Eubacteriales bacterium]
MTTETTQKFNFGKIKDFLTRRKKIVAVAVVALILLLIVTALLGKDKKPSYLTQKVASGEIRQSVNCSGFVQPVQSLRVTYKNSGLVKSIPVQTGDKVVAGQLLAAQATDDSEVKLAQAEAALQSAQANYSKLQQGTRPETLMQAEAQASEAEANLSQASANRDRIKSLYEAGAVSRSEYDSAETAFRVAELRSQSSRANLQQLQNGTLPQDLSSAEAQVKSASAQLQAVKNDLSATSMTAPFDGYIALINGNSGQWTPGGAPPLSDSSSMFFITLVSRELELSCQVNEADIGRVKVGQDANFTVDTYPDRTFAGKVKSIAPQATTVSGVQLFNVTIAIPVIDLLKGGLPVNVNILTETRGQVLLAPLAALEFARRDSTNGGGAANGQEQVIVMQNGRPQRTGITTGLKDGIMAEVLTGLQEGDELVVGIARTAGQGTGQQGTQPGGGQGNPQGSQRSPGIGVPRVR